MTIQIDDAGWGCLIGPVLIGAYRIETQEFAYGEIPVRFFQPPLFGQKAYLNKAAEVARQLLRRLKAGPKEEIQICRGYVLDGVREWLAETGLPWRTVKVEGPLQVLVETALQQELAALGLRVSYEVLTQKQGLLFWLCLRWLKGGDIDATKAVPGREKHAKTGWASYHIWVRHPYAEARRLAAKAKAERRRRPW